MQSLAAPAVTAAVASNCTGQHHVRAKLTTNCPSNATSSPAQACSSSSLVGSQWPAPASSQGWHHQAVVTCLAASSMLPYENTHDADCLQLGSHEVQKWQLAAHADNPLLLATSHANTLSMRLQVASAYPLPPHQQACWPAAQPQAVTLGQLLRVADGPFAEQALASMVSQLGPPQAASLLLDLAYYTRLQPAPGRCTEHMHASGVAQSSIGSSQQPAQQNPIQQVCLHLLRCVHPQPQATLAAAMQQDGCSLSPEQLLVLTWACGVLYSYLTRQQPAADVPKEHSKRRMWHTSPERAAATSQADSDRYTALPGHRHAVFQELQLCAAWAAQELHPVLASAAANAPSQRQARQQHLHDQPAPTPTHGNARFEVQPSGLTCVVWGLAQVQMRPSPRWLATFFQASSTFLPTASARAASTHSCLPSSSANTACEQYSAQHLSLTLWALGRLQLRPPPMYLASVLDAFQQQLGTASQQSLANAMWSLGRLRTAPSKQFLTSWCASFRSGIQLSCQQRAGQQQAGAEQASPAAATVSQEMLESWDDVRGYSAAQEQHHISQALWALARLSGHVKPCQIWLGGLLTDSTPSIVQASPQSLSNTMWALGELGHSPSAAWLSSFFAASQTCLDAMGPQGVCNILHGLAQVRAAVPQAWADNLQQMAVASIKRYNAAQLSQLMWCLSQLDVLLLPALTKAALHAASYHMCWYGGAHPEGNLSTWRRDTWPTAARSRDLQSSHTTRHLGQRTKLVQARAAGRCSMASRQRNVAAFASGPSHVSAPGHKHEPPQHSTVTSSGLLPRPVGRTGRSLLQRIANRGKGLAAAHNALQMRLLRSAAKRAQQARVQARQKEQLQLCNLAPDSLARLLHALAKGTQDAHLPPMRPYWRAACVVALRLAVSHMDALSLSQTLVAALSLGVRPPLPPTRRALHRVVRDSTPRDANHLVSLLAGLATNKHVARDKWVLYCMQSLQQHVPHLSSSATLQLAKALPLLHARVLEQQPNSNSQVDISGPVQHLAKRKASKQQQTAAAWALAVSDLSCLLVARCTTHLNGLVLEDMQGLITSLSSLPPYARPTPGPKQQQQQRQQQLIPASATPWDHFLHAVQPRLPQLPCLQLVYLLASLAGSGCERLPGSFMAAVEAASQAGLAASGLGGVDKVQLLSALRHLRHTPSAAWMATWYNCTARQLGKMGPQHLNQSLRHAEELTKLDLQLVPPRNWLQAAAYTSKIMPKAATWALKKQLGSAETLVAGSAVGDGTVELTVQEVQLLGATAGHLLSIFARLQNFQEPITEPSSHALLQTHCQALADAATRPGSVLPSIAVLHALHEVRMLQPAAVPAYVRSAAGNLALSLTKASPRELFLQIWEHAAVTTTTSTCITTNHQPGSSSHSASATATAASQPSAGPPVAALAAAHRVVEMLAQMVRWGAQPPASWLHDVLRQVLARAKCFSGPQASALLRAVALLPGTSSSIQPGITTQLLDAFLPMMCSQCSHAQLAEVGWAISALQAEPSARWWQAYEAELLVRMKELGSEELCEIMWACGSLRHRPNKQWMEAWAGALLPQLPRCNPDQLARLVWALAAIQQVPGEVLMQRYLMMSIQALHAPGAFCAQSLSLMIGGLATLGAHPRPEWLAAFAGHFCSLLPQCRGVHLVKILGSLAAMGYKPPEDMLRSVVSVTAGRVSELDQGAAAQLTWAMGRLDASPGQKYLQAVVHVLQQGQAPEAAAMQPAAAAPARPTNRATVVSRKSAVRSRAVACTRRATMTEHNCEAVEGVGASGSDGMEHASTDDGNASDVGSSDQGATPSVDTTPVRRRWPAVGRKNQVGRTRIARRSRVNDQQ